MVPNSNIIYVRIGLESPPTPSPPLLFSYNHHHVQRPQMSYRDACVCTYILWMMAVWKLMPASAQPFTLSIFSHRWRGSSALNSNTSLDQLVPIQWTIFVSLSLSFYLSFTPSIHSSLSHSFPLIKIIHGCYASPSLKRMPEQKRREKKISF